MRQCEWRETWFGSSEELYSVNTLPWSDTYSAFSLAEQSRDVKITESFGAGAEEEEVVGISGRKERFHSSISHYTSAVFLDLFLRGALLLVLASVLRLYLRGLVDEGTSAMCSSEGSAWGRISESSCSWQQSWPVSGWDRSAPSWWALQKELGHSWQKASEFFPHTSQWCQGQSQRPGRKHGSQM